ncbi:MAG: MerR family transcriptional regulator [Ruminococcus sp.]|nr:MerR family transcriptional regulator [Ruminococcus sp.]
MFTIKVVAKIVGESEHTIRYYCKEGLFPFLTRDKNNVRKFSEADLEGVRIVLCLRDTGMPISEIKRYMELCAEGNSTLHERLQIITEQKQRAYEEMKQLQSKIEHLEWKEKHYIELIENGAEDDCNPVKL